MAFQKIGIMSIGEMGFHWAKLLKSHGVEVLTYDRDRAEVSRKRAENAGVKSLDSMNELVRQAELIVSIVVPSAATNVAAKVAEAASSAGRKGLVFLDANAISPMSADEIAMILRPAGVNFVDGCIIGSAAKMGKGSIVYVSGADAARLRDLEAFQIPIKILGDNVASSTQDNLAPGCSAKPPEEAALNLRANEVRVDDDAAIQREHDALDVNTLPFVLRHLNHLRTVAQIVGARDAACATFRRPRSPA